MEPTSIRDFPPDVQKTVNRVLANVAERKAKAEREKQKGE